MLFAKDRIVAGFVAAAALLAATFASAQTQNSGAISMKSVRDLNQRGGGPVLIGGTPASSRDWPASFYSSQAGSRCTSTLIGPRALLLAAHCVGDGQVAEIEIGGRAIQGRCKHEPSYAADPSADYALCLMDRDVTGITFETVNVDPQRVRRGAPIILTGYGCTAPSRDGSGVPGNDGIYRVGTALIAAVPGEARGEPNTIVGQAQERGTNAMICPGDSGGGAYVRVGGTRRVVAVNSRVIFANRQSLLSSLSSPVGHAFLTSWSSANNASICGVNLSGRACR